MFKMKHSLSRKITASFALCILVLSLLFSVTFYKVAMGIVDQYVLTQFEHTLKNNIIDLKKNVNKMLVNQSDSGSEAEYQQLLAFLDDEKKRMDVENVYVLAKKDKTYIVALSGEPDQRNADYPFTAEMNAAFTGEMQTSSIYKDVYGIHKSAFLRLEGTDTILGIDMDAAFIQEVKSFIISMSVIMTLISMVLGCAAGYVVARRITRPILAFVNLTQKVAEGDLRDEVHTNAKDEIGRLAESFNMMIRQLKEMVKQVTGTSDHVLQSANHLSQSAQLTTEMIHQSTSAAQEIASGSEALAQVAVENAQAMEEIATGVQHITESSVVVSEETIEASRTAAEGNQMIQKAVTQMDSISASLEHSTQLVKQTNERTSEIGHVVELITDIASQINLLALNAAIEAARAGEYGRGFAVVADEVRKLAEQSAKSASEITGSLQAIREDSFRSVEAMNRMTEEVAAGSSIVDGAGQSFERILHLIDDIAQKIQAVSAVTQQVSASAQEISASAEETAQITGETMEHTRKMAASSQEQLATMEENARTASTLHGQADELRSLVGTFRIE
ncbi:methyl-accepting chemotaxis protein [Aneurinibacillus sp. REN35]|uniref:methyl-accepting chemotaxis protein n=1 Tax=Aneurinibacillus sp. REN35 TaxID=3237286 RepID=UPI0035297A42